MSCTVSSLTTDVDLSSLQELLVCTEPVTLLSGIAGAGASITITGRGILYQAVVNSKDRNKAWGCTITLDEDIIFASESPAGVGNITKGLYSKKCADVGPLPSGTVSGTRVCIIDPNNGRYTVSSGWVQFGNSNPVQYPPVMRETLQQGLDHLVNLPDPLYFTDGVELEITGTDTYQGYYYNIYYRLLD